MQDHFARARIYDHLQELESMASKGFPSISVNDSGQTPECSICSERYDDSDEDLIPRNLACGHSLCSKCIFRCMYLNGRPTTGGTIVECPSKCANVTVVPDGMIKNLPKNFAVLGIIHDVRERSSSLVMHSGRNRSTSLNSSEYASNSNLSVTINAEEYKCDVCETRGATIVCPSCAVCLCISCSEDIHSKKGYRLHQLVPGMEYFCSMESLASSTESFGQQSNSESDIIEDRSCKHHTSELTEYACETCAEEICKVCLLSGEHVDHESRPLADIATDKKEALKRAVDEIDDCHNIWNKGFDECHELQENLFDISRKVETDIKTHFHAIHSLLHAKEESLLSELREEVEIRSKSLQKQADHLAKVCAIAKDLVDECERLLHHGTTSELVREADKILVQSQQYIRSEQDITPVVACAMDVDFSSEKELVQLVNTLGQLLFAPDRVQDLKVISTTSNMSEVTLTWKPPTLSLMTNTGSLTYIVEHSTKGCSGFKNIHESVTCEYVLEDCHTNEDSVHTFQVAAVNNIGKGPYSLSVNFTKTKASFLWDNNLKHPKAHISNNGYSVAIGENATWVSAGTDIVLSHGRHYWEVVLDRYGSASLSRKVVVGVVSSDYHQWHRSHGIIGIKTCPIGSRSWGLACGTAKKLSSGSTFFNSLGRKHNLFKEGDSVGVLLDLSKHTLAFYRNGEPLGLQFNDVYGPVIPAISFCRNKSLSLQFPPFPGPPCSSPTEQRADSVKSHSLPTNSKPILPRINIKKSHTTLSL